MRNVVPGWKKLAAVSASLCLGLAPMALAIEPAQSTPAERVVERQPEVFQDGLDPVAYVELQNDLSARLTAEMPARLDRAVSVQITALESDDLRDGILSGESPLKVGIVKPLDNAVRFDGLGRAGRLTKESGIFADGTLTRTPDGGLVWASTFDSAGAGGIRVHIENMNLPQSAELYFYSQAGEAYGSFTARGPNGDGDLWLPSVRGSSGILQLRVNPPVNLADLRNISFDVTEIGHIDSYFYTGVMGDGSVTASFCQFNESCVENTNCINEATVSNAENAVAKMLWVAGCCIYTCSGGLIADNDPNQGNYFLTANHCLSRNRDAQSLEAFFRYQVSCGTSTCTATFTDPPNNLIAGKTLGASVRASGSSGDFTLLQLSQNPPSGSVFLGWNNSPVAFTNGAVLHRVHHASGAPQCYSQHHVDTGATTCQGWPRGQAIYSRDDIGATEGGSSGSPVVNASGQIVGQLTGGCGFNIGDVCDAVSNATVDGALAHYWSSVQSFLDPGSGGGGCLPVGSACTSNSQCCSNSCKGPAGNKTCK